MINYFEKDESVLAADTKSVGGFFIKQCEIFILIFCENGLTPIEI